jgi:hypothetical protein
MRLTEAIGKIIDTLFAKIIDALPHGPKGLFARQSLKVNIDV